MCKYKLHARLHSFISKQNGAQHWPFAYSSVIICAPSVRADDLHSVLPDIPSKKNDGQKRDRDNIRHYHPTC